MATLHFNYTTTATPEQFVAALTDFGPGRSELFGNSADEYLKVHDQGPDHADVTEGSGGVWERLHYDWSDPDSHHHEDHRLQRVGRRPPATPTPSRRSPTGRPRWTRSWSARARTSRDARSRSCSARSARACWPRTFGKTVKAIEARNATRIAELV